MTNSIRPFVAASQQSHGEAQLTSALPCLSGWNRFLGTVPTVRPIEKAGQTIGATEGDWRRNGQKIQHMKQ
jgi:hypothetical protein